MNTLFWGKRNWEFLSGVPWAYRRECLTPIESSTAMLFIHYLSVMLPCLYCRMSYVRFQQDLNLQETITLFLPRGPTITRGSIALYLSLVHDRVNVKLSKPSLTVPWQCLSGKGKDWWASVVDSMLIVCWNYPEKEDLDPERLSNYSIYFNVLLPSVLSSCSEGCLLTESILKTPLSKETLAGGRSTLKGWAYRMADSLIPNRLLSYQEVDGVLEGFRARNKACATAKADSERDSMMPKGCF